MGLTMEEKIKDVRDAYTKAIDKLTSTVEGVGSQVNDTQVAIAKINGNLDLMNEKIDGLSKEKEKAKSDSRDYVLSQIDLHEAKKHNPDSDGDIRIKLPWKIASGGFGVGGGGVLIYYLMQFLNKQ